MANRKNTFLMKRSNVAGNIPSSGSILLGEMALNTADVILYASGTTANSILPIGWDRVHRTGDTMTGPLYVPSISAQTITVKDYIDYELDGIPTPSTGRTYYDVNDHALSYFPDTPNMDVTINIGQESVIWVYNNTGSDISNGQALHISGANGGGDEPTVELAIASGNTDITDTRYQVSGIATHEIKNG